MSDLSAQPKTIAIVGGGFSGTMTAVHLLRLETDIPLKIVLFERAPVVAKGAAYRATTGMHLLNVPMGAMSAFPDEPTHLVDWCRGKLYPADPKTFMARQRYGEYLGDVLFTARARKRENVQFEVRHESVVSCQPKGDHARLTLADGEELWADTVVLALGNFPPGHLHLENNAYLSDPCYHANPWGLNLAVDVKPEDPILIIGTALTMVDMVVTLREQGHRGPVLAVSRHGFLPRPHQAYAPPATPIFPEAPPARLAELVRFVRAKIAENDEWRMVIDGLRPYNQRLWQGFTKAEKRRFLRHIRPFWEIHRHRMAPELWETIHNLREEGYLKVQRGRIDAIISTPEGLSVTIHDKQMAPKTHNVAHVFNCAGARTHYGKLEDPLVHQLMADGLLCSDPLNLGLDADSVGALKNANGESSPCLLTLGPPLKGMLMETTAVPELRVQAQQLAAEIFSRLQSTLPVNA